MKNNSFIGSLKHAIDGIESAIKTERNLKIDICFAVLVIVFGTLFRLETWEWIVCIAWIVTVIGAELFNTAIENIVDMASPDINSYAKNAKDMSAGAVLVLALGAAVSGVLIFAPKLYLFISSIAK